MMRRRDFLRSAGIGLVGVTLISPMSWAESLEPQVPTARPGRNIAWMHGDPRLGCASVSRARMELLAVPAFDR
jgi:hypothetical protein